MSRKLLNEPEIVRKVLRHNSTGDLIEFTEQIEGDYQGFTQAFLQQLV